MASGLSIKSRPIWRIELISDDNPLRGERDGTVLAVGDHRVEIAYDPDGEVWFVRSASLGGLAGETASTREDLEAVLPALVATAALP